MEGGLKRTGCEADYSSPLSDLVKKWSSPSLPHWPSWRSQWQLYLYLNRHRYYSHFTPSYSNL